MERRLNPAFRPLNAPLTLMGAERKLFFFALTMGAAVFGALPIALALAAVTAGSIAQAGPGTAAAAKGAKGCELHGHGTNLKHVIYLQFDNTHLFRDRSNFASDLEQMPHLLNFLQDNGTLSDNEHTILISHTAGGILSSLTGLYPDRTGQAVSNSYGYFRQDGSVGFSSSFKYWTDVTDGGNLANNFQSDRGVFRCAANIGRAHRISIACCAPEGREIPICAYILC